MTKRTHSDLWDHHSLPDQSKKYKQSSETEQGRIQSPEEVLAELSACNDALERLESSLQPLDKSDPSYSHTRRRMKEMSTKYLPLYERLASNDGYDDSHEPSAPEQNQNQASSPLIPSTAIAPWTSSEIPQEMPPLPPIKDPELERQTFQHPGIGNGPSYARLEWLGDAFLELIATVVIFVTFTTMSPGRCSQLREQLIRNITLAGYFRDYGLMKKANLPELVLNSSGPARGRSADKDLIKAQGDMFEAYVAAVIVSDPEKGLTTCVKWLRALWSRSIKEQIIKTEREAPLKTTAQDAPNTASTRSSTSKEELSRLIVVKGVQLQYKDMPGKEKKDKNMKLTLFTVGVFLTGWGEHDLLLGWGTALSKKEAGQKAATRALENKKLMKVYIGKKQAFLEARKAAEGAEDAETG